MHGTPAWSSIGLSLGPGVEFLPTAESPREFHEEITGTDSWIWMEHTLTLAETGTCYFVAFPADPAAAAGRQWNKLWMAIGTRERFGLKDIFSLGRIRGHVRDFHEVRPT